MSEFMDRARAEAEGRGAGWAEHQRPNDAAVEAVAEVIYLRMPRSGDEDYADLPEAWKKVYRDHARAALLAAQKVRAGQ